MGHDARFQRPPARGCIPHRPCSTASQDAMGSFILTGALYAMIVLTKTGMVRARSGLSDATGVGI